MITITNAIVVSALLAVACARQGPYLPVPVYNQYVMPYPTDYIPVRHARSPDSGSSSFASSSSSAGGGSTSGTFMGPGGFGTMNAYAGMNNVPNNFGFPPAGFGYGVPPPNLYNQFDFFNFLQQYFNQLQAEAQNRGGFGGNGDVAGGIATAHYSPQGGYGSASVFPPTDGGIDNRFGETPSGPVNSVSGSFPAAPGTQGVFTSSQSGFSDVNGHKTSFKTATVGINKDGKVTTYTAHSP